MQKKQLVYKFCFIYNHRKYNDNHFKWGTMKRFFLIAMLSILAMKCGTNSTEPIDGIVTEGPEIDSVDNILQGTWKLKLRSNVSEDEEEMYYQYDETYFSFNNGIITCSNADTTYLTDEYRLELEQDDYQDKDYIMLYKSTDEDLEDDFDKVILNDTILCLYSHNEGFESSRYFERVKIESFNETAVTVFPSPAVTNVKVQTELTGDIVITDAVGLELKEIEKGDITISDLDTGIHFIKVKEDGEVKAVTAFYKL